MLNGRNFNDRDSEANYGGKKIKEFLKSRNERMKKTRLS